MESYNETYSFACNNEDPNVMQHTSNIINSVGDYVNDVNMGIYEVQPGVASSSDQYRSEWINNIQLQPITSPPSFDTITGDDFMFNSEQAATVRYDAADNKT